MRAHLTDISVRSLKPTEKQMRVWDEKTPGFGVLVNGRSKSWIVMYGETRRLKVLGRYPDVSLADARATARRFLVAPVVSGDPDAIALKEAVALIHLELRAADEAADNR